MTVFTITVTEIKLHLIQHKWITESAPSLSLFFFFYKLDRWNGPFLFQEHDPRLHLYRIQNNLLERANSLKISRCSSSRLPSLAASNIKEHNLWTKKAKYELERNCLNTKKLTIKHRRMHAAAPGNKVYQKFKLCSLTPSMKSNGKLAAAIRVKNNSVNFHYKKISDISL